jgi:hypothetical protein
MEGQPTVVWSGTTPRGLRLVIERDSSDRWIATVAGTMRSRNRSAAIAVAEAAGLRTREPWVRWIARLVVERGPALAG